MLKTIDPLLGGDLLKLLADMGHGEVVAVVDRNYPSLRHGVPVLRLEGVGVADAVRAILSVLPLDSFVSSPVTRMQIDGEPETLHEVHRSVQEISAAAEGRDIDMASVSRPDFYALADEVSGIVQTGEALGFSCFFLRKGVIF